METKNIHMALFEITSILSSDDNPDGIKEGYVILGIKPIIGIYGGRGECNDFERTE